jgi:hypothetical protein
MGFLKYCASTVYRLRNPRYNRIKVMVAQPHTLYPKEVILMSPRIHLSIDQELFDAVEKAAKRNNTTVNFFIIKMLEGIRYDHESFDYMQALNTLIKETVTLPHRKEFVLLDLPSFGEICVIKAEQARLQPAAIRASLGKAFNQAVRKGQVPNVKRAETIDKNGHSVRKFRSRAAVYVVDRESSST